MAVKIRLTRRGRKKQVMYDVIVADARSPRDGRFIEKIGTYNPNTNPASINIDDKKALDWVLKGAQPTDTVKAMLSYRGIMMKKHLQIGVNKGAISQEDADKKFELWLEQKNNKIQGKVEKLSKAKTDSAKAKLEAEVKVNKARTEAILKKRQVADAALVAQVSVANADDTDVALEEEAAEAIEKMEAPSTKESATEEKAEN
jgi:small subunit ribosomal protein S16